MRTLLRLILIPIAIGAIVLAVASMFIKGKGLSTRDEPSRIETVVAMQFRSEREAVRFEKYLKSGSGRAFATRHFGEAPDRART